MAFRCAFVVGPGGVHRVEVTAHDLGVAAHRGAGFVEEGFEFMISL